MVPDLVVVVLALLAVSAVPLVVFAGLFALIDRLADEEKIREVRQARREGRPIDFPAVDSISEPERPFEEGKTVVCSHCDAENAPAFDRCWRCQSEL